MGLSAEVVSAEGGAGGWRLKWVWVRKCVRVEMKVGVGAEVGAGEDGS